MAEVVDPKVEVVPFQVGEVVPFHPCLPFQAGEVVPFHSCLPFQAGEVVPFQVGEVVPFQAAEVAGEVVQVELVVAVEECQEELVRGGES